MRARIGVALAFAIGFVALASPQVAFADDPVDLDGAYVVDTVGAISGREANVQAAIDDLYERARIQLFVVYVDDFTGAAEGEWATETAIENGLGDDDILLAIATESRNFEVSVAEASPLSDEQLSEVESDFIIPELRENNWADAAIAAAEGYAAAATGVGPQGPDAQPQSSGGIPILPILGVVAVGGAGIFIYSRVRKRNREGSASSAPEQLSQKQLDQRAGSLLVQLDDSLKTSEQELGFAVAQFGEAETAAFTAALASASDKVRQAFALKQQLDDSQPETESEKRAVTIQIIELCEAADAELDEQADAFDELRKLEQNAPQELATVQSKLATIAQARAGAEAALETLRATYSEPAIASVSGNVMQADKLIEFANAAVVRADQAIAADKRSEAAVAVRAAGASVGQAEQLFKAIDALTAELAEARDRLQAAIADTRNDIAVARALDATTTSAQSVAPAVAAAESAVAAAEADSHNPLASLTLVHEANTRLDSVFTIARTEQEKIERARAQLDTSITAARAQIDSTARFVTTRRGSISETARTRLSEADRHLNQALALATTDPVAALADAQSAHRLASTAMQLASSEVDSYLTRPGYPGGNYGSAGGPDLGGIIGDLIFGGSGSSGGGWFGGSSGGGGWSSGRSGSSYRPSRTSRSGGFGGSSRSSSRSSGGGRRSRGGRF